jgi:hypothetical protein
MFIAPQIMEEVHQPNNDGTNGVEIEIVTCAKPKQW